MNKIIITGVQAHFKIPSHSKYQNTYEIPPVSTVVGMLQNIYGKGINDFTIGYFIEYEGINTEIVKIYKELNMNEKTFTNPDRFTSDIVYVSNLSNPRLVIYTDVNKEICLSEPLTLGKANYLARLSFDKVLLIDKKGIGINQYTPLNIGNGKIMRINTLTEYNCNKGYYDYKSTLLRVNSEFEYDKNYDCEEDVNIVLYKWKDGEIFC